MKQVWTLEPFFTGGSGSAELKLFIEGIERGQAEVAKLDLPEALLLSQVLKRDLAEAGAFVHCLAAQDVGDLKAKELEAKINGLSAENKKIKVWLDEKLAALSDGEFERLFGNSEIRFHLLERRQLAKKRLPSEKEALIEDLAIDGYHGWSNYHSTLVDSMSFLFKGEKLSQGQIDNQFSKGDRGVRKEAFESYLSAFKERENQFGAVLNHIGGFRLKMYQARGWKSATEEPCDYNRISEKTLEAMWDVVAKNRGRLSTF